jgi:hypothetical protein
VELGEQMTDFPVGQRIIDGEVGYRLTTKFDNSLSNVQSRIEDGAPTFFEGKFPLQVHARSGLGA